MASQIQNNFEHARATPRSLRSLRSRISSISRSRATRSFCRRISRSRSVKISAFRACSKASSRSRTSPRRRRSEFVSYTLDKPKYDVDECRQRGMTFAAPIKVTVRLVIWDTNEETGSQSIRDVKEQEVFFGEIPLMTDNGTFIITVPSVSWSASYTAVPACSTITTRARRTARASCSTARA